MTVKLTIELSKLLDFLVDFIDCNGFAPSYREIKVALKYKSTSIIRPKLLELEELGKIKVNKQKSRAIEILELEPRIMPIKSTSESLVFKLINCDNESANDKQVCDNFLTISKNLIPNNIQGDCFLLKMIGSSMTDVGIDDGDFVLIRKQNSAKNKDIVYALINDELATIKKYIKQGNVTTLCPANKSMKGIAPEKIDILGIVVGCLKLKFK